MDGLPLNKGLAFCAYMVAVEEPGQLGTPSSRGTPSYPLPDSTSHSGGDEIT
jgi:hypothetical protein